MRKVMVSKILILTRLVNGLKLELILMMTKCAAAHILIGNTMLVYSLLIIRVLLNRTPFHHQNHSRQCCGSSIINTDTHCCIDDLPVLGGDPECPAI